VDDLPDQAYCCSHSAPLFLLAGKHFLQLYSLTLSPSQPPLTLKHQLLVTSPDAADYFFHILPLSPNSFVLISRLGSILTV
jgi:hypothetical protein